MLEEFSKGKVLTVKTQRKVMRKKRKEENIDDDGDGDGEGGSENESSEEALLEPRVIETLIAHMADCL